ncbi:MAG: hypothetical protein FWD57_10005 [Polyangiaceae bacterium]|nr:hypothetical protein [Polyangiaceae bacterium]
MQPPKQLFVLQLLTSMSVASLSQTAIAQTEPPQQTEHLLSEGGHNSNEANTPSETPPGGYGTPESHGYTEPPPYPDVPPPPQLKGMHRHDGFYFRFALGPNRASTKVKYNNGTEFGISSYGLSSEILIGGTPIDGFVLGGRLVGGTGFAPSASDGYSGGGVPSSVVTSMLQVFTDIYPIPDDGWHVMAAVGLAGMGFNLDSHNVSTAVGMNGLGLSVGGGYEPWIGEQWSLGLTVLLNWLWVDPKFDGSPSGVSGSDWLSGDRGNGRAWAFVPSLALGITYH